ncbi:MAG: hypothetical protein ACE5H1_05330 [Thermodesulfobacteriota bacterium]
MTDIIVDGSPINYDADNLLPTYMRDEMKLYIEHRIPPGDFLAAVLSNDLIRSAIMADDINRRCLFEYIVWLRNYAPPKCYGSYEKVKEWLSGA